MATVVAYRRACLDNGAHQGGSEAGSEGAGAGVAKRMRATIEFAYEPV